MELTCSVFAKLQTDEIDPLRIKEVCGMESQTMNAPLNGAAEDMQSQPILEAVGLQKTYGRRRVVDGVNLTVGKG